MTDTFENATFVGDDETPARYLAQLANALWRHYHAENWVTLDAVRVAATAVAFADYQQEDARRDLDTNPAWALSAAIEAQADEGEAA